MQRALCQATEARQNAQPKEQPTESPSSCEDPKPEPAGVQPPPPPTLLAEGDSAMVLNTVTPCQSKGVS